MRFDPAELVLIRHAPAQTEGRLAGRRDVPAMLLDAKALARGRAALAGMRHVVTSPALRCRQTAKALFPKHDILQDARLWEQDFGVEEGMAFADLPDLGPLSRADLAIHRPPKGESFADMVARATPALEELAQRTEAHGPLAVVAHAGTVRAALALALGTVPAALGFEIAPLSVTRLRCLPGAFSIISVNQEL